jgi:hypothetical protein
MESVGDLASGLSALSISAESSGPAGRGCDQPACAHKDGGSSANLAGMDDVLDALREVRAATVCSYDLGLNTVAAVRSMLAVLLAACTGPPP